MRTAAMRNFHLPMPAALYSSLREAAARTGSPATDVAREAIQVWLMEERRRKVREELEAFVEANAGTAWDLDPKWEAAGLESIAKLPPWPDDAQTTVKVSAVPAHAGQRESVKPAVKQAPRRASRKAAV